MQRKIMKPYFEMSKTKAIAGMRARKLVKRKMRDVSLRRQRRPVYSLLQ